MSNRAYLEEGKIYSLNSSFLSMYKVLRVWDNRIFGPSAELRNTASGWTFNAVGTNLYQGDCIDWEFSTDGRFEEV